MDASYPKQGKEQRLEADRYKKGVATLKDVMGSSVGDAVMKDQGQSAELTERLVRGR